MSEEESQNSLPKVHYCQSQSKYIIETSYVGQMRNPPP